MMLFSLIDTLKLRITEELGRINNTKSSPSSVYSDPDDAISGVIIIVNILSIVAIRVKSNRLMEIRRIKGFLICDRSFISKERTSLFTV